MIHILWHQSSLGPILKSDWQPWLQHAWNINSAWRTSLSCLRSACYRGTPLIIHIYRSQGAALQMALGLGQVCGCRRSSGKYGVSPRVMSHDSTRHSLRTLLTWWRTTPSTAQCNSFFFYLTRWSTMILRIIITINIQSLFSVNLLKGRLLLLRERNKRDDCFCAVSTSFHTFPKPDVENINSY